MTLELVYHVNVSELHFYDWGVRELHIKAYCMKKGVNDKVRYFYDYQRASKLLKFVLELLSWGKQRHRDLLARQFSTPF